MLGVPPHFLVIYAAQQANSALNYLDLGLHHHRRPSSSGLACTPQQTLLHRPSRRTVSRGWSLACRGGCDTDRVQPSARLSVTATHNRTVFLFGCWTVADLYSIAF